MKNFNRRSCHGHHGSVGQTTTMIYLSIPFCVLPQQGGHSLTQYTAPAYACLACPSRQTWPGGTLLPGEAFRKQTRHGDDCVLLLELGDSMWQLERSRRRRSSFFFLRVICRDPRRRNVASCQSGGGIKNGHILYPSIGGTQRER